MSVDQSIQHTDPFMINRYIRLGDRSHLNEGRHGATRAFGLQPTAQSSARIKIRTCLLGFIGHLD